jgi:hypothetical protein
MKAERIFYVTQGSMSIWMPRADAMVEIAAFADDDEGLRQFDAYQSDVGEKPSAMLIDVIEEEFALETIPKLGARDRGSLIERRCQNKFRRTPYRQSIFQGKAGRNSDEFNVVHSAVSNHELVDPWLQIILKHRTPLSGVYSVPLIAPSLYKRLFKSERSVMFVAPHQGNKLRQVFMDGGHLRSARLSQAPAVDDDAYAQFVVSEALRSRRYLERTRMLNNMQVLEVCVVAKPATAEKIAELSSAEEATDFSFVSVSDAGKKLLGRECAAADRFEETYLDYVAGHRSKHDYAKAGESRYWTMRRMRQGIIGTTATLAIACSFVAAVTLSDAWFMHDQAKGIQSQVMQLAETFRRENEKFDPIKADSHEMKLAVDTGDFILENRVPVPWVMNQVSVVLSAYPEIQVRELRWEADTPPTNEQARRGNRPMPVLIHPVATISAVMTADISPFDGDMRRAFQRIDQLTRDLEQQTDFSNTFTVEYPFNDNPAASVSGEITNTAAAEFARFRLNLTYDVPGAPHGAGEGNDDAI